MAVSALLLAFAALLGRAAAVGHAAEVLTLPGWLGKLPSRSWSGFVDGTPPGEKKPIHSHYWLFESEGDPDNDPLIVWTNGGPGASSMFGLLVELGPFYLSTASLRTADFNATGVPTLFRNEFSWTKLGNLLIYNAPAPVGYSYCGDDPAGDAHSCGAWDDKRQAQSAHVLLKNILREHPQFARHDVYITGESYAGIYVPTLAREILSSGAPDEPRVRGLAVGDGCVGSDVNCFDSHGPQFLVQFLHGHQQFSEELHETIRDRCAPAELRDGVASRGCAAALDEMDAQVGGFFAYSLYDECTYENGLMARRLTTPRTWRSAGGPIPSASHRHRARLGPGPSASIGGALNDYPCGGGPAMDVWVNQSAVRKALHVPLGAHFFSFDNAQGFVYRSTEASLLPFYRHLALRTDVRVLIYNGDTDPGLNAIAAQNWTRALGLRAAAKWRPWTVDGRQRVGGSVTEYEGDFTFLTIRGAGHMVPEFKPEASFEFVRSWLRKEPFKPYVRPGAEPAPASRSDQSDGRPTMSVGTRQYLH